MTKMELVKRLADSATRPLTDYLHQPTEEPLLEFDLGGGSSTSEPATLPSAADLFIWFEDTSMRETQGRPGIAGLPESLLPVARHQRSIERRYVPGHLHLLSAVRLRCSEKFGERIAAIYTAALSVGTVAWIGTGSQYELAWEESRAIDGEERDQ